MAETIVLKAEKRAQIKSRANSALRAGGSVPAVIYGKGSENENLSVKTKELVETLKHGHRVVVLEIGSEKKNALIKQVQYGTYDHEVMHVDFEAVTADSRVQLYVDVVLVGTAAGVAAGGVVSHDLHSLHIECPVLNIPAKIEVDVSALNVNDIIHVSDLKAAAGVKFLNAPATPVAACHMPAGEEEAAATAEPAEGAALEPEVIGKKKEDEEEAAADAKGKDEKKKK